jgi:hypothetical protein
MKLERREWLTMAIATAIGGPAGYLITARLLAPNPRAPADVSAETPARAVRSPGITAGAAPDRPGSSPGNRPGPPGAVAIRMPPLGSFDLQAMEHPRLRGVRGEVKKQIGYQAGIACSGIEVAAETRLRVTVPVRITSGTATLLPITGVEVARGASPPPEFVTCVSGLISAPLTLSGPVAGKWPRTPDAEGDVLVLIGQMPRRP